VIAAEEDAHHRSSITTMAMRTVTGMAMIMGVIMGITTATGTIRPRATTPRSRPSASRPITPVALNTLEMFLDLLRSAHGDKILRMKGIVQLADDPSRPVVFHVVQHLMHPPARLEAWPDADRRSRMVCITKDLAPEMVRKMFGAFQGVPRVDTPDKAALTDNPLAIR
jgi:hypothetical protein